jgi:hypothetical protein
VNIAHNKPLLIYGGIAIVGVFGLGWFLTQGGGGGAAAGAQNAVNPNAQTGAGAFAQGTMPDIGNLLSYNQVPGALSAPQATSTDWFSRNYGVPGDYGNVMGNVVSNLDPSGVANFGDPSSGGQTQTAFFG